MSADIESAPRAKSPLDLELRQDIPNKESLDVVDENAQAGVQKIEAVTLTWTKRSLIVAYSIMWLIYFAEGLLSGVQGALSPYLTSAFTAHSLTPTVSVISSVIGGVSNVTIAKILDVFGRPQGYAASLILAVAGLGLTAGGKTVEAYAAANVFYNVGNSGLQYSISVVNADTTSLKNRGLIQAILSSPNLVTCWLGGPVSTAFLDGPGWRWGFGAFAIVIPACSLPLLGLFVINYQKAKKLSLIPACRTNGMTACQLFWTYCRDFDIGGVLLVSSGVAFFLLPFNIHTMQAKGWASPICICFWVFGVSLCVLFVFLGKVLGSCYHFPLGDAQRPYDAWSVRGVVRPVFDKFELVCLFQLCSASCQPLVCHRGVVYHQYPDGGWYHHLNCSRLHHASDGLLQACDALLCHSSVPSRPGSLHIFPPP